MRGGEIPAAQFQTIMKKILCLIAVLSFVCLASAEDNLTARLNATVFTAGSTNSTAMQPSYGWKLGDVLTIQCVTAATNASAGNLRLTWDTSLDSTYWVTSTHTTLFPAANGTTVTLLSITNADGSNWIRQKTAANTNGVSSITITKLSVQAR